MSPRDQSGAVPIVKLAELDSSVHYIREQTDRDRRAWAERNRGFADRFDKIDRGQNAIHLELQRVSDTSKRLELQHEQTNRTLDRILDVMAQQRGSLVVLRWLVAATAAPVIGYCVKYLLGVHS
jgi:hypothetical protein